MKNMKKWLTLVLVALFMLAMSSVALADVTPATDRTTETDGSVKVINAKAGQTYTLYLLFKADMGANDAITYTSNGIDLTGNPWFELNANGFVVAKDDVENEWAKDPAAIEWVKSVGTKIEPPLDGSDASETGWTGLEYGYYFVDTTLGAFVGVNSANKDAEIMEKNEEPKVDKSITAVDGETTTLGLGDDTTDPGQGANEKAIAQVGDTVSYQVVVKAKPGAENYVVTDVMENLALVASSIKINGVAYESSTIVDKDKSVVENGASSYTIVFKKEFLDTITSAQDISITYDAIIIGTDVTIGEEGNENTATLTYGHKETPDSSTDSATVYTAKINVIKTDGENGLAGATFALKNSLGQYYLIDASTGEVSWVADAADATTFTSESNGELNGEFKGLSNGEYTLEETIVPEGYNAIDPNDSSLKFTIAATDYTNDNLIKSATVINNAGSVLPSTGGIGTTIFYVVGGLLVVCALVFFITKRRMSATK